jgi:hypothetical protein
VKNLIEKKLLKFNPGHEAMNFSFKVLPKDNLKPEISSTKFLISEKAKIAS